jgi:hypothetical protein
VDDAVCRFPGELLISLSLAMNVPAGTYRSAAGGMTIALGALGSAVRKIDAPRALFRFMMVEGVK